MDARAAGRLARAAGRLSAARTAARLHRGAMQLLLRISLATLVTACAAAPPPHDYAARIRRTSFGIPHIDAADERGLGYGLGYAFAQDNACVLAEEIVTVNAERSRYFGPDATYQPDGSGHEQANLPSDVYLAVHNAADRVAAAWAAQPAAIQALLRGYARGYNRYLRDAAGALPAACRGQPWVRPISELDLMRVMSRLSVEASGMAMLDELFAAQPPGAAAVRPTVRGAALADAARWRRFDPALGSNGVALGRDATASGAGLLLAAPHFPWHGSRRFYQLHLTIPGRLDVFGATLAGLPVVAIGHNAAVAWTHTVNTSRHFAFTRLALDPRDPRRYLVDGVSRPLIATDVVIQARQRDGTIAPVTHRVWSSEYGPLVVIPGLLGWTTDAAFAFGDANAENTRFLATWWQIDHARSLSDLRTALATLGAPWVQTLAVDAAGTVSYDDVTAVPNLPDATGCVPAGFAQLAATGLVVLDGSTARCAWRTVPGTPAGLVPAARLPSLTRTDFVQNSNDSAWLTQPAAPLTGFPAIVSRDGIAQNPRTRLGISQLVAALAAGQRFTPESLLALAFSDRAFHATTLLPDLRALCAASTDAALTAPCAVLGRWDGTAGVASVGWPMFRAWRRALGAAGRAAGTEIWTVAFDPADPVATPRGLRIVDPAVAALARAALITATRELTAAGIDAARPWGELQGTTRGGRWIPIPGGGGDHFGDGGDDIYDTINSRLVDGRLEPFYGSSLVLAISFAGGSPRAQGLLTYSQSSDPASPHHADQTARFSRKAWIALPFTDAAIAADPALTTLRLAE